MNIYSIKNEKLGFFNRPIYCESHQEALTYIQNVLMSDADRALRGLREDLALYFLGEIDFTNGNIVTPKRGPVKVSDLKEIFETIPEDKIPRDSVALLRMIEELAERLKDIEQKGSVANDDE